ncbi:MAG: 5-oxoprolinase subunit PxpB [Pseudomonadota bacterium]
MRPQPRENPAGGQASPCAGRWVGERGLRLATGVSTPALYETLKSGRFAELEDIIPADDSILLVFRRGCVPSDALAAAWTVSPPPAAGSSGTVHALRVEYGSAAGPDLAALAARAGLHPDDYINRHAAIEYRVAFLGFQPGFPYLRGLPPALQSPRRASPRTRVPAGSVAVGGAYTGIYPADGPGGWQLIGRTDAVLFDPVRAPACLLMPGDRVRLVPA